MIDDMFEGLEEEHLQEADDKDIVSKLLKQGTIVREYRGTFVGTPLFVAPEMLNDSDSGPFSDLWALGVIIYELIQGSSPWRGNSTVERFECIK